MNTSKSERLLVMGVDGRLILGQAMLTQHITTYGVASLPNFVRHPLGASIFPPLMAPQWRNLAEIRHYSVAVRIASTQVRAEVLDSRQQSEMCGDLARENGSPSHSG